MARANLDDHIESFDLPDTMWTCAICGRARLCPYAVPAAGDPTHACWSCGDLLARTAREISPRQNVVSVE